MQNQDGQLTKFHANIWAPMLLPATDDRPHPSWGCFFQIAGLIWFSDEKLRFIAGDDSFQALTQAIKIVGTMINKLAAKNEGCLLMYGEEALESPHPWGEELKYLW